MIPQTSLLFRILFLWPVIAATAAPVWARSLAIERFDVLIRVDADGSITVTETIHPRFTGKWNGIYRTIPVEYRTPQGFNKTLFLDLTSVTGGEGGALKYESSRERHYRKFKIWVPGAEDAARTVKITYRVPNALLYFEDHDELYWNITGDEWEVPIEQAGAVVQLPTGTTGIRTLVFTGAYGSRESEADVEAKDNEVYFRMRRPLSFREGLTAVIGWDKGFVKEPSQAQSVWLFLRSNWPLFIPIGVFAFMFRLWWTRGRDPKLRPIVVQFAPPEGLTPGEAGTLIDGTPDMRDITATIVDLAVRGYLLIEETKEEHMLGLWSSKDYSFHKRTPPEGAKPLKPHESALLESLFAFGNPVTLSSLQNRFYTHLPGIKNLMYDTLLKQKYYGARPDMVRVVYVVAAIAAGLLTIGGGGMLSAAFGIAMQTVVVAGLLSAATIIGFGWVMPARTTAGTRALEGVLGFEEFLGRVEEPRFEAMIKTPEMFEKYLPYAMALGVEKRWVAAFDDICKQPPDWYRGSSYAMFRPSYFVSDMNRMTTSMASTMASSPRSSGGSGFGGGGSSGGGGGGGGGGGF